MQEKAERDLTEYDKREQAPEDFKFGSKKIISTYHENNTAFAVTVY